MWANINEQHYMTKWTSTNQFKKTKYKNIYNVTWTKYLQAQWTEFYENNNKTKLDNIVSIYKWTTLHNQMNVYQPINKYKIRNILIQTQ